MLSPRMPSITSFCKNKTKPEVINEVMVISVNKCLF